MSHFKILKEVFDLDGKQLNQLNFYFDFLRQENKVINLTSLISTEDVCYKHFYDSLILQNVFDFNSVSNLCDVGSGAGFPSFPLKIIYPRLKIIIIEASLKKISFLKRLSEKLKLNNITFLHQRVEQRVLSNIQNYDCVVARALGNLSLILNWCLPLVKKKGYFIAMKGKNFQQELDNSKKILLKNKTNLVKIDVLDLPMQLGKRANLVFQTR